MQRSPEREINTSFIQLEQIPLIYSLILLVWPDCYSVFTVISIIPLMMKRLASNLYANHKAGRVMDGLSDRLRRLVWEALSWIFDTFYLVIHKAPHCLHPTPRTTSVTPTSCLWPLIIALPLLAMCWESKGSHLSLIRMEPHHLLPHALNHNQSLVRQRWIGTSTTLYLSGRPPPSKGLLSLTDNRGDSRRSGQVKSAAPGRKLSQSNGGKFFSL